MNYIVFQKGLMFLVFYFLEIAFILPTNASETSENRAAFDYSLIEPKEKIKLNNELSSVYELRSIDTVFNKFIKRWGIAGASVAIAKEGRLVYAKGFGKADKESGENVHPDHLFRIASVSKLITAVGIMKLVEDGKLQLDDKVFGAKGILNDSTYAKIADPKAKEITVRHLLKHQGGWSASMGDPMFETLEIALKMNVPPPADPVTVTQYILSKRLHFRPGTRSSYSNVGYCILGQIIEKVSGENYENYILKNILQPLRIENMQIGKNMMLSKVLNEVSYYDYDGAVSRLSVYGTGDFVSRAYDGTNVEGLGAAGGWIASSSQLLKLVLAIDGFDTKPDILSVASIEEMTSGVEAGGSPLGWKGVDINGNWWRTGTLAGSSALVMRQADGTSFAVILNSSIYSGARFTTEINKAMQKALNGVEEWPVHDLFNIFEPTVISPITPKGFMPIILN
ncbi:MAG: beta-lactamase family protein [Bacteroidota bacterium]|nr:beta-lactamase family protein [Bacteroidota bacterium]